MAGHWGLDMKDALDVATDDTDLAGEIALLAELMVAVADARVPLDQAAIDIILLGRVAQGSTERIADC